MLTLFGFLDRPPTAPGGLDDFLRSLRFADLRRAVAGAEPVEAPARVAFSSSVRRRYERMRDFPAGLVVMGDALCTFNPIYGQGMTVAALQALALRDRLGSGGEQRAIQGALARASDAPWELAIGADLAVPGVAGDRTARRRVAAAYVARLQAAAARDPALADAFVRVTGLVDPPQTLARPSVALGVLRLGRRAADRDRVIGPARSTRVGADRG